MRVVCSRINDSSDKFHFIMNKSVGSWIYAYCAVYLCCTIAPWNSSALRQGLLRHIFTKSMTLFIHK